MTYKNIATVLALLAVSTFGVRGAEDQHAHLSDDLLGHVARHTSARTRVIVHGDADTLAALTTKHHVSVLRTLAGGAVISANSAELAEIAADSAVDHLSGDPLVKVGMSVSNQATAADQVRAGVAGGLFGMEVTVFQVRVSYDQKPYRRRPHRNLWRALHCLAVERDGFRPGDPR